MRALCTLLWLVCVCLRYTCNTHAHAHSAKDDEDAQCAQAFERIAARLIGVQASSGTWSACVKPRTVYECVFCVDMDTCARSHRMLVCVCVCVCVLAHTHTHFAHLQASVCRRARPPTTPRLLDVV
jgi:hypothetical protein